MHREGLVVKRPGVLSKVQMLNLVLGVGVFSLLPLTEYKLQLQLQHPNSFKINMANIYVRLVPLSPQALPAGKNSQ